MDGFVHLIPKNNTIGKQFTSGWRQSLLLC